MTKPRSAIVLAEALLDTVFAKTTHGLIRGPSRFPIAAVIDSQQVGCDAGQILDGVHRNIPVFESVAAFLASGLHADVCIVGVATVGGVLPPAIEGQLLEAAREGMTLVNGLHRRLAAHPTIAAACQRSGAEILDLRVPPPIEDLHFWSGEILDCQIPRIAVLGTDCAIGKRTTAGLLRARLAASGVTTELVFTGQTGWLQGYPFGFILDATPNDFVGGELEHAVLRAAAQHPDLILIEGQAALRHPAGPSGSEHILCSHAAGVILQHAPGRICFEGLEQADCRVPSLSEEIDLIRLLGGEVWAICLNGEGLDHRDLESEKDQIRSELDLPVFLPLEPSDIDQLAELVRVEAGLGGVVEQ